MNEESLYEGDKENAVQQEPGQNQEVGQNTNDQGGGNDSGYTADNSSNDRSGNDGDNKN